MSDSVPSYELTPGQREIVAGIPAAPPSPSAAFWGMPTAEELASVPPYKAPGQKHYNPGGDWPDGYRPGDK